MACGGHVSTAITAVAHEGLSVEVAGQPASLAIVDQHGNVIDAWAAVVTGAEALDYDARMQARQLVADTFERIVIHHRGMAADSKDIDLVLRSKTGNTRLLRVCRATGDWRAMEDVALPA